MASTTSLATVSFEGDLRLTVLQALSIDRLFELDGLAEFVIVANGSDNAAWEADFRRHVDGRISDELQSKLRILTPSDIPRGGNGSGWYGQQVIKLALADIMTTGTYLMLDGKNHFIRPSSVGDFFRDGVPLTVFSPTPQRWEKYLRASLEALDAYTDERMQTMMPTTTPYLMQAKDAAGTMDRLEAKFDMPFDKAIRETHGATEFFLYFAFLLSTHKDIPYASGPSPTRTLYTSWPEAHSVALEMIEEAGERNVPMFGLHRNRLPQLSSIQSEAIKELWSRHLLKDWEDADWFLAY